MEETEYKNVITTEDVYCPSLGLPFLRFVNQLGTGVLPKLQSISRQQRPVPLEEMTDLEGRLYGIIILP